MIHAEQWIEQALPRVAELADKSRARRPWCTDDDISALRAVTAAVEADTDSSAEDRILAWRKGRAAIMAQAAERLGVLGDDPHPDSREDWESLLLAVIENAWHESGRPRPSLWADRDACSMAKIFDRVDIAFLGGDRKALRAFDRLVVESRKWADDETSPNEVAEGSVLTALESPPRFAWSL